MDVETATERLGQPTEPVWAPALPASRFVRRAISWVKMPSMAPITPGFIAAKPRSSQGNESTHCRFGVQAELGPDAVPAVVFVTAFDLRVHDPPFTP
jgi:hypothetical protein